MSLYKTRHLRHPNNARKKLLKVEVRQVSVHNSKYCGYGQVWFTDERDIPFWLRYRQEISPFEITGLIRAKVKSIGRARPHIFQRFAAPRTERYKCQ